MSFKSEVEESYERISKYLHKVPLIRSDYFSEKLNCNLYFKLDNIQHTGSFKVRGALSRASLLDDEHIEKGFVTASGGNHGLGVCYAAKIFNTTARIYVPEATPEFKKQKIRDMGGEVLIHGNSICEASYKAIDYAEQNDKTYIHGFNDEDVIRGQGTLGLEILNELPETDMIIASIGGGGLIAGIAGYAKEVKPEIKIYGAQTKGCDAMRKSLDAGTNIVMGKVTSIAESLAISQVAKRTLEYVERWVDDVCVVTDDEAMKDVVKILQYEKQLVEPAASCSLSILTTGQVEDIEGKNIVVVLCGSNFPVERLKEYL
jgi:threonine dehydratase